jgi:hypothetical protein
MFGERLASCGLGNGLARHGFFAKFTLAGFGAALFAELERAAGRVVFAFRAFADVGNEREFAALGTKVGPSVKGKHRQCDG